jgi:hypothetical protein
MPQPIYILLGLFFSAYWKPEEGPPEPIECLISIIFGNISTFFNEIDELEIQERDKAPIEEVRRTDSIITSTYRAMPIKKKQNAVIRAYPKIISECRKSPGVCSQKPEQTS